MKNIDLWQQLDALLPQHEILWNWVKGHNGHPENERVDKLAREQSLAFAETKKEAEK